MRFGLSVFLTCFFFSAFAQWKIYPVPRARKPSGTIAEKKKSFVGFRKSAYKNARLDSVIGPNGDSIVVSNDSIPYLTPRELPFWDDFSSSNNPYFPDSSKWRYGESVSWNFGVGINPPSLGVASFDGLDSIEKPYDLTNQLAKGFGDRLTSWTFNLDTIPLNQRDSVYLSFYFEYQGNGEAPDAGDHLLVEFRRYKNQKDTTVNRWIAVGEIDVDSTISRHYNSSTDVLTKSVSVFYPISIKVDDPVFFHDQFQFRISSFGRISGPWDTWVIDYVYFNKHRFQNDVSFPDRTISTPLTSLFGNYWSIPAPHFHADSTRSIFSPTFSISNLAQNQIGAEGQPIIYRTSIKIDEFKDRVASASNQFDLSRKGNPGPAIVANEHRVVTLDTLPSIHNFTKDSDSIRISLRATITSGDDIFFDPVTGKGDYTAKFLPIDFRVNDTTTSLQVLSNYYAYDDGSAEFAAGLNQPGTEVAYRFDMKTAQPDFLLGVDMYFPNVGDESAQTITLVIRKDTSDTGVIYSEIMSLQRSSQDRFVHHRLNDSILQVKGHFYVGYRQTNAGIIAVGLDQSNNTANKIIFNALGYWQSDTVNLTGSLMIRPIFGRSSVDTGIEEKPLSMDVFPNPSAGSFYLSMIPDQLEILDFTGRRIEFSSEPGDQKTRLTIVNAVPGIYLLKASLNGQRATRRIMVQR